MPGIDCCVFIIQVRDGGECNLSEVTASAAGGLNTDAGHKNLVHHFEMKPVLGIQKNFMPLLLKETMHLCARMHGTVIIVAVTPAW